jgi:ABC-type Fe3+-citrate transport system substrate-binding protein
MLFRFIIVSQEMLKNMTSHAKSTSQSSKQLVASKTVILATRDTLMQAYTSELVNYNICRSIFATKQPVYSW